MSATASGYTRVEMHPEGGFLLTPGVKTKPPTHEELLARQQAIVSTVNRYLEDIPQVFAQYEMSQDSKKFGRRKAGAHGIGVTLHQDSFAANLDVDELLLLGTMVKYAGIYGIPITILGTNRQTCRIPKRKSSPK